MGVFMAAALWPRALAQAGADPTSPSQQKGIVFEDVHQAPTHAPETFLETCSCPQPESSPLEWAHPTGTV